MIGRSLILPRLPYRNGCLRNLESGGTGNTFEHKVFFHMKDLVSINIQYRNKYNKTDLAQHVHSSTVVEYRRMRILVILCSTS